MLATFLRKKAIEKTILRILRRGTFSHSLDPDRTLALAVALPSML